MSHSNFFGALTDRGLSYVTRWHQKPTGGFPETMAEHCGWVARLALYIGHCLENVGTVIDWNLLMDAALRHDDSEQITGDIPGSLKYSLPEAKEQSLGWEKAVLVQLYEGLPHEVASDLRGRLLLYLDGPMSTLEFQIVKLADRLSALAYAMAQVSMGNTLFEPIQRQMAHEVSELILRPPIREWWRKLEPEALPVYDALRRLELG